MKYSKIMKSDDNAKLGGILSGLAYYYNIDSFWLRIIFAFLFIFFGLGGLLLLSYFVAWIVIDDFDAKYVLEDNVIEGESIVVDVDNSETETEDNSESTDDIIDDIVNNKKENKDSK